MFDRRSVVLSLQARFNEAWSTTVGRRQDSVA